MKDATKSKDEFKKRKKAILQELEKIKKIKNSDVIIQSVNQIIKMAQEMGLSVFQRFAFHFYSYYNHLIQNTYYYDKFVELSQFMLQNIFQENFRELAQNQMKATFQSWNLFEDKKKSDDLKKSDIDDYETCFSLCLLTKNVNLMKLFFIEYLNIDISEYAELRDFDLENPYAIELFKSLFNKIYIENKKKLHQNGEDIQIQLFNSINESNHSNYNLFRCENCFSIKHIKKYENNIISLRCMNCDDSYSNFEHDALLAKISDMNFSCGNCKSLLFLHETNLKCITCKKLICRNCKDEHLKYCFSFDYIKLYEVGYKCEIHCKNYIEYCFKCNQNLCKSCKNIHCHKTYEAENIEQNLEKINFDENDLIIPTLITIYKENNRYYNFNGFIYGILCSLQKIDMTNNLNNIFFTKFNDQSFQNYYEFAFRKVNEGNLYYLKRLKEIKKSYLNKKINELIYDQDSVCNREKNINGFIERTKSCLFEFVNIHNFMDFNNILSQLMKSNSDLLIRIEELQAELLYVKNANKQYEENTHNILARFLANELLNKIIYLYHDKLDEITLNINTFLELISSEKYEVLSNMDIINSIAKISKEFDKLTTSLKENPDDICAKNDLIKYIKSSDYYKIKFVEDIIVDEEELKKEDLNKLLELLFFIKSIGNKTAHPNIDPNKPLININAQKSPVQFKIDEFYETKLEKVIEKEIQNHRNIMDEKEEKGEISYIPNTIAEIDSNNSILKDYDDDEDKSNYYNSNEYKFNKIKIINSYSLINNINDYKSLVKKEIVQKLKEIRNELLSRYNLCKMKKEVKIEDIIDVIFNNKDEKIFEGKMDIVRIFIKDTDDLIEENLNIDINDKLFVGVKHIHSLFRCLTSAKSLLNNFEELMVPKHKNLDGFIKQKILSITNLEDLITFIENMENTKFYESKIGCERNELVAEICFLLLNKIFLQEMSLLDSVKNNYEKEIIKNILFKEISIKLKKLNEYFSGNFTVNPSSSELTNSILEFLSGFPNSDFAKIDNIKNILIKIIKEKINLTVNEKISLDTKLFYHQNVKKK